MFSIFIGYIIKESKNMIESRYKALNKRKDVLKNRGFNYKGRILMRTTDPNLYKNDRIRGFAFHLEDILYEWFRQAKRIKTFVNYIVDGDSEDIN
jgi:hypothetical protein